MPHYEYKGPAAAEWTLDADFVVGVTCAVESRDDVWQGEVVEFRLCSTTSGHYSTR